MNRRRGVAFLVLGIVFLTIASAGPGGFYAVGVVFIALGVTFLLRHRRLRGLR